MTSTSRGTGILAVVIAAVVGGVACTGTLDTAVSTPPSATGQLTTPPEAVAHPSDDFDAARTQLEGLAVKGRAPKTGYSRDEFGQSWTDDVNVEYGHNGCDTRNDILRRDLTVVTYKPGTRDCVVVTGVLADPYSGKTIDFVRGEKTSTAVQIDHVVAMSDAWQKGAAQWDVLKRTDFANDPINLQAVDGPTNQQKSDGDAATWLPPNKAYRCTYIARQIDVKARYEIWVTAAEKNAMTQILAAC
ncbi:HNH endonuclease family protein [Nocardia sp. 348MFTsu5.1]|uniref:HNH endonuclease family protein n=1 Tax=Nocardia sp. 348MFTsu5.1 TaxID=1172185 RepID=UPI000378D927